jgi:phosphatidylserine/phosphatidylglycerophosphate/cardiolipin synthase-like enzyme
VNQDAPALFTDSRVTPLLDGAEYAEALSAALDRVGRDPDPERNRDQLILVSGWWLGLDRGRIALAPPSRSKIPRARIEDGPPFCLDPWPDPAQTPFEQPPDESTALLGKLIEKARAGVDVRVLGWVSSGIRLRRLAHAVGAGHIVVINALTLRSIAALRAEPALADRALPNLIGHPAGSTHSKIALVHDGVAAVAFAGGMDLEYSRWARTDHTGRQTWHDVISRIEGPAVQGVYDHFKTMWDANLRRAPQRVPFEDRSLISVPPGAPELPERTLPVAAFADGLELRALETLPAARHKRGTWMPRNTPLPGAPRGRFTYREALREAVLGAERYVYAEDQLFWSTEFMDWLNQALRSQDGLRAVFLLSGADDPNDPPLPHDVYLCQSVNHHLLRGLSPQQSARVHAFRRANLTVHAKTVLVDDERAFIGSMNLGARSFYTDVEFGFAVTDPAGAWAKAYRRRLWGHHLGEKGALPDLEDALSLWTRGGDSSTLRRLDLPVAEVPFTARARRAYEGIHDPDSRRPWGGLIPKGMY